MLVPEIREDVEYVQLLLPPPEQVVSLSDTISLELVMIPTGQFWMGSKEEEGDRDEHPRHLVKVAAFWMGRYPVTQAQWRVVANLPKVNIKLEPEPSDFQGDDRPVERVAWKAAIEFCQRLSRLTKQTYDLPSEAEWEYACRANTETAYHFGETITEELANLRDHNPLNKTTSVGQYGAVNAFGLYDMHGNVSEWCLDHWHETYDGAPTDGSAWLSDGKSAARLLRGGSWTHYPVYCRSANRVRNDAGYRINHLGFRVVLRPA